MKVIFPPRPTSKMLPRDLFRMERTGEWVVQRNFGGHRTLIHVAPDAKIQIFSRYGRPYRDYEMPTTLRRELSALNYSPGNEYWLDAELMHPRIAHTVVLFDILQAGKYLYGVGQLDRLSILTALCRQPIMHANPPIALCVSPLIWLAETWDCDFQAHFKEFLHLDVIEGLVLRKKHSRLDNFGHRSYNVPWQVRCRKPGPKGTYLA